MPSRQLAVLVVEVVISLAVWWVAQPEHERKMMAAKSLKAVERSSMYVAKQAANVAAKAEAQYRETVSP